MYDSSLSACFFFTKFPKSEEISSRKYTVTTAIINHKTIENPEPATPAEVFVILSIRSLIRKSNPSGRKLLTTEIRIFTNAQPGALAQTSLRDSWNNFILSFIYILFSLTAKNAKFYAKVAKSIYIKYQ